MYHHLKVSVFLYNICDLKNILKYSDIQYMSLEMSIFYIDMAFFSILSSGDLMHLHSRVLVLIRL